MPTAPATPKGLGRKAAGLWRDTVEVYDLRPDELRVLEEACRELALIEQLDKSLTEAIARGELIVAGSMGQKVANPLVQEVRQHRATMARLLAGLKLPDEQAEVARSARARDAANSRWRRSA